MKAVTWHGERDVRVDSVPDDPGAERHDPNLPLEDAPHAYEIFQKKQDGAIKILLQP
jgi:threonine dehydrogenase-like Zn-dependent dehydrogenase